MQLEVDCKGLLVSGKQMRSQKGGRDGGIQYVLASV